MATIHLPPDFKDFLQLLKEYQVRYLLIGGYAVTYHGYPRATADMDIWISRDPANAEKLIQVLTKFGFDEAEISLDLFMKENQVIRMGVPPLRIEIITSLSGIKFNDSFPERVEDTLDGINVNIINLEQLKINKRASGRLQDLNDLENLP